LWRDKRLLEGINGRRNLAQVCQLFEIGIINYGVDRWAISFRVLMRK
jgi:hypothetical protein